MNLKVHSIFESISGEAGAIAQGTWMTFIRLQGCNLKCKWCDTPQAMKGADSLNYKTMQITDIVVKVNEKGNSHVLITGGEPLVQRPGIIILINYLTAMGFTIQIETNGSFYLPVIEGPVSWVVDHKTPSSGQSSNMIFLDRMVKNFRAVGKEGTGVFIKWVVQDKVDMDFALRKMSYLAKEHSYFGPHIISPVNAQGEKIQNLVDHIKRFQAGLDHNFQILNHTIFSVQLHKIFNLP